MRTMMSATALPFQMTSLDDDARSTTASQSSQDVPTSVKTMTTADVSDKKAHKIRSQFFKTQVCRFHRKGYCRNGGNCAFAHGDDNVAPPPDLTKTSLCTRWVRGECPLPSHECVFAHGHQELRVTETFKRTSMCSLFMRGGYCPQGAKCRHAHSIEELQRSEPEEVMDKTGGPPQDDQESETSSAPRLDEPYHLPLMDDCGQDEPWELPAAKSFEDFAPSDGQSAGRTVYPVKDSSGVCWLAVYSL